MSQTDAARVLGHTVAGMSYGYIVPLVQLASQVAPWIFVAGIMLQLSTVAWIGVILFGASSSSL